MAELAAVPRKSNVLVVDDEPTVCQSVAKILNRKGYEVTRTFCVSAALESLESGSAFDLVIADLMMPQVGGMELLKIVRDRWPDTPVLIITGYASIASAVEATKRGAVGYLPKPFTPEELENAVGEALNPPEAADSPVPEASAADPIDVDMPFDRGEVARATSAAFVDHLTRSDVPLVDARARTVPDFCAKGDRTCKRVVKQGICKQTECPQITAERKKAAKAGVVISMVADPIDVDMPFSRTELASVVGESYVNALGRSDLPVVGHWRSVTAAPRVLVVDDEPVVVNSIRKTLARRAFRIDEAFSGREALEKVRTGTYDLVLLDMRLPDADGLDLMQDLRKKKPNLRVVIVTGYASVDTAVEAIRRGADDYMAKPFTPDELTATAARAIERVA